MSVLLPCQKRLQKTQGELSVLRKSGWIPSVLYGGGQDPVSIQILEKAFLKQMQQKGIYTRVFELEGQGRVLLKSLQFPATKDIPLHADFVRLQEGGTIRLDIPLRFINEDKSPGIKKGGILNIVHPKLRLNVSTDHIPSEILIDLTGIEAGKSLSIEDLVLPAGSKVHGYSAKETVLSIVALDSGDTDSKTADTSAKK